MIKEATQKMKLIQRIKKQKVERKFPSLFGWEVHKKQARKLFSQETSQISPHYKINTPKFDELPGEDKEDWHSEKIICIALGMEDLFQPKKNFEERNSGGAQELVCKSDFRITREIKSDDKPTKSEPEFQMPKEKVAELDELRVQPASCLIPTCQGLTSSKVLDKEMECTQQHFSKEPQVKIINDEAKGGVMQLLIGGGPASETLEAKRDVILGAQNLSDSGSVRKFPKEKFDFFCVNHLEGGAKETYIHEHIYDEESHEGQECWPQQEFILPAANTYNLQPRPANSYDLRGLASKNNVLIFDPGGSMQSSWSKSVSYLVDQQHVPQQACLPILTTEEPAKPLVNKPNKALENGGEPKFADYQSGGEQDAVKEESSFILTNMRVVIEDASCRDSPTAANSFGLENNSSYLGKKNIIIFDPGGLVPNNHSKGVYRMIKDLSRI